MKWNPSGQATNAEKEDVLFSTDLSIKAKSKLTKLAAWINDRNIPFLVTSIGMIVVLLWAGSYKMTAPGAEGSFLGLFLFKDVISLGVSFYLISYFGKQAILSENEC